jgi:carbon starvation protein
MSSLPVLATIVVAVLAAGYLLYGRFLARQFALDDARRTPAEEVNDGEDFVPTKRAYLLGQHLSAIAAAGPIAGPILACQQFGWLPCVLWIGLGVVFIGAVHDFASLVASVRHRARSVAEIVKEHVGTRGWAALLVFIWIALVYVIVAFTEITVQTFRGADPELAGISGEFHKGGAVAAASTFYLLLALVMGLVQRLRPLPLWLVTVVFVPATFGVIWLGTTASPAFVHERATWAALILGYCFVASLLPVWTLLQPRGYLGGFVLYISLALGVVGIFFGDHEIRQPVTTDAPLFGAAGMFPMLFVTIACGACSGFHGLVCSGTTSKQIAKESHCRSVGYGAMLLEAFVALIALATIATVAPKDAAGQPPGSVYGAGLARFLALVIGDDHMRFARTFGTMVFSTFVFDTLDVATRLGRYLLQELTGRASRTAAILATAATAGAPLVVLLTTRENAYRETWTLFGASNQLLAALTLLVVAVWLVRTGRRAWFVVIPMTFLMAITVWSLGLQAADADGKTPPANRVVAVLLVALAAFLVVECVRAVRRPAPAPA